MKAPVGLQKHFKRRLNGKQVQDIYTMYWQGLSIREIGRLAGIPHPSIARAFKTESYQDLRRV